MVRFRLTCSIKFLSRFCNQKRFVDYILIIIILIMHPSYLIGRIDYEPIISHIVPNHVDLIVTPLSTRSDIIANVILSYNLMSTPINYMSCLQGNRIMRAAQAGDVEAVRRCLDSGTDVNSRRVIIFSMSIDVFA